jgi:hypothetical protein
MKPRSPTRIWKVLAGIILLSVVGSATRWVVPDSTTRLGDASTLRARAAAARACSPVGWTPDLVAQPSSVPSEEFVLRTRVLACPATSLRMIQRVVFPPSRARAPPRSFLI